MSLTLYGSALSPYTRAARVTLAEKTVPYTFEPIGPTDLQAPGYEHRHPYRKLPALDINGQPLFETSAIMRFVDEAHQGGMSLQPENPVARAFSEQWLSAANSYLYGDIFAGFVFQLAFAPQFGMPTNQELVEGSLEKTRYHLNVIDAAVSTGELGEGLSLGDILVAAILLPLRDLPEGRDLLNEHSAVRQFVAAMASRPSVLSTAA